MYDVVGRREGSYTRWKERGRRGIADVMVDLQPAFNETIGKYKALGCTKLNLASLILKR